VKSIIAGPADGPLLKSKAVHIHGAAWAGEADVVRVEISTDSGATWQPAQLSKEQTHYAWRLWNYDWKAPKAGDYTLMSRATDSQGRTQPQSADWNPSGYLYNAIDQVKIHVAA
jgi:Mo-co oxidoreductase dimerisation domain